MSRRCFSLPPIPSLRKARRVLNAPSDATVGSEQFMSEDREAGFTAFLAIGELPSFFARDTRTVLAVVRAFLHTLHEMTRE